ncbi:hypothetical protein Scep_010064 [Stephania cephalantha]|uniref:Uncharacterized protein n=1 Tax=Stephania cephalantha TaxID=152367 RepID=A0AAP0JUB5_9MAGN
MILDALMKSLPPAQHGAFSLLTIGQRQFRSGAIRQWEFCTEFAKFLAILLLFVASEFKKIKSLVSILIDSRFFLSASAWFARPLNPGVPSGFLRLGVFSLVGSSR